MSSYTVDSISARSTAARPAPNGAAAATWHAVFEFEEPLRRAQHAAAAAAVLAGAVLKTIPIEERGAEEEALEGAAWEVFDRLKAVCALYDAMFEVAKELGAEARAAASSGTDAA